MSFLLGTPEMDAALLVGSHQCRVEGQNHLPECTFQPPLDAAQDKFGFLGSRWAWLGHVQALIHQHPQVLLLGATLHLFIPTQPVLILGDALTQVWHLVLGLVKSHEIPMGPLLKPVQIPLDGILSFRYVNSTTQLCVIDKVAEGALNPLSFMKINNP
ncbi:hypothetical protein DUI87_16043 [Hirundo rustica rustica]|uniref:Uncharacterized protein n=1 Tax=Hirundo rustica rustica TaxID=333673 RepID=A0A3M0K0D5_HIRRU|nr:hypothetical protein DUI87_16043 [Hirundo rustica rustica]